jgi:hypothetical protein
MWWVVCDVMAMLLVHGGLGWEDEKMTLGSEFDFL